MSDAHSTDELFDPAVLPDQSASSPSSPDPSRAPTGTGQGRNSDGTFGHKHPEWLLADAREQFFDEATINETPTEQLGRLVRASRLSQKQREADFRKQQVLEGPRPQAQPQPPPPPPAEEQLPDLSHLDEVLAETIRKTWTRAAKAEKAEKELAQLRQDQLRQQAATIAERVDDAFAALPPELQEFLGEGDHASLTPQQLKRRNYILDEAGIDVRQLPSPRELKARLLKTARALVPAKEQPKPDETGGYGGDKKYANGPSRADWQNGAVNRPSQRGGGSEPPGEAKAVSNLAARMRERGLLPEQTNQEILDGIPD